MVFGFYLLNIIDISVYIYVFLIFMYINIVSDFS